MKFKRGKSLFAGEDQFNLIEIKENHHLRWMHFGSHGIQSAINTREPHILQMTYQKPFADVLKFIPEAENVLILGLGGGSLLNYLAHEYPALHITAIEQSHTIIHLANQYFFCDFERNNVSVFVTDALEFIATDQSRYDYIAVDLADAHRMPYECSSETFIQNCSERLSEHGVFVLNCLVERESEYAEVMSVIRKVFGMTVCIPIDGYCNIVIVAFKDKKQAHLKDADGNYRLVNAKFDCEFGLIAEGFC